jgi:hypothetical protein
MERDHATRLIGIIGIAGGLMIMFAFPIGKIEPAVPTIKVPGPYPYETPVQVPVPTISESSVLPTPAPFPYPESSSSLSAASDNRSQIASTRRPLTAKAVREAAFKYNGVPDFCEFLAALPADVSVFDPKLGRPRTLVKGGRVVRKNAAWLRKRKQARLKPNDRTLVSVEELGTRNSGIWINCSRVNRDFRFNWFLQRPNWSLTWLFR